MRLIKIELPSNVNISATQEKEGEWKIKAKGPKGEVEKRIKCTDLKIEINGKEIKVSTSKEPMINTVLAHVKNLIKGVSAGYSKKMIMRYSHFPMTCEIASGILNIKNFLGERKNRKARICGSTKITVKGQELIVEGQNKEDVSQTVANIRQATKIKKKDSRVFQDGIYPVGEEQ